MTQVPQPSLGAVCHCLGTCGKACIGSTCANQLEATPICVFCSCCTYDLCVWLQPTMRGRHFTFTTLFPAASLADWWLHGCCLWPALAMAALAPGAPCPCLTPLPLSSHRYQVCAFVSYVKTSVLIRTYGGHSNR